MPITESGYGHLSCYILKTYLFGSHQDASGYISAGFTPTALQFLSNPCTGALHFRLIGISCRSVVNITGDAARYLVTVEVDEIEIKFALAVIKG